MERQVIMKQTGWTTISQGSKLLELGLDPKTADMSWVNDLDGDHIIAKPYQVLHKELDELRATYGVIESVESPAWSLATLLELMPQTNKFHTQVNIEFNRVVFEPCDDEIILDKSTFHYSDGTDLLEACYNMIVWLLENKCGYIKKGE